MIKNFQMFLKTISVIFFLTASTADAAKICTRGALPSAEEYGKAKSEIKNLELDILILETANHPGDKKYTNNLNKEFKRRESIYDQHIANLKKVQLPQNLADCIESNYSLEELGELYEMWHKMASIYLKNQNYPFNEKLIHQVMMIKTFGQ